MSTRKTSTMFALKKRDPVQVGPSPQFFDLMARNATAIQGIAKGLLRLYEHRGNNNSVWNYRAVVPRLQLLEKMVNHGAQRFGLLDVSLEPDLQALNEQYANLYRLYNGALEEYQGKNTDEGYVLQVNPYSHIHQIAAILRETAELMTRVIVAIKDKRKQVLTKKGYHAGFKDTMALRASYAIAPTEWERYLEKFVKMLYAKLQKQHFNNIKTDNAYIRFYNDLVSRWQQVYPLLDKAKNRSGPIAKPKLDDIGRGLNWFNLQRWYPDEPDFTPQYRAKVVMEWLHYRIKDFLYTYNQSQR